MNKATKAIISSILHDLSNNDRLVKAKRSLDNSTTMEILLQFGCPKEVINAMKETVHLSLIERKYCVNQIKKKVNAL